MNQNSVFGKVSQGANNFNPLASNNTFLKETSDFFKSNSMVGKFAFLILALMIFVTLLRLGSSLLASFFAPSKNPVLINGMIDARQQQVFPQDPTVEGSVPILRSDNDDQGMEFTWSVWIYIDDFSHKRDEYKHIFHKGNANINVDDAELGLGKNEPNNAPGLYITPHTNDLLVVMNTFDKIDNEIIIQGIPLKKWINVMIRLNKQNQLDVYINGTLTKRHILQGVAKQNYGNVYASMNNGFSGYTSELRYFNTAIGTSKIRSIVEKGPNLKMSESSNVAKTKPYYLSNKWYFTDLSNM